MEGSPNNVTESVAIGSTATDHVFYCSNHDVRNSSVIHEEKEAIESLLFMKTQTMSSGSASTKTASITSTSTPHNTAAAALAALKDDQQLQNNDTDYLPDRVDSTTASVPLLPQIIPSDYEVNECKTLRAKLALQSWYQRLNELYEFKEQNGHCDVPQKYPPNRCLGIWVNKQRCEKVLYDELQEQQNENNNVQPTISRSNKKDKIIVNDEFHDNIAENNNYDDNDDDATTNSFNQNDVSSNNKTNLTAKKLQELEKVGFIWAKRKGDVIWNLRYHELYEFYQLYGHSDLPCKYRPKPTLGRWVTSQRSMYKRGTLPPDYIQKLDDIKFTWDMYSKTLVSTTFSPNIQLYANESSSSSLPQQNSEHKQKRHKPANVIDTKTPIIHNDTYHCHGNDDVIQSNDHVRYPNKRQKGCKPINKEKHHDSGMIENSNSICYTDEMNNKRKEKYVIGVVKVEEKEDHDSTVTEITYDDDDDVLKNRSGSSYHNKDIWV